MIDNPTALDLQLNHLNALRAHSDEKISIVLGNSLLPDTVVDPATGQKFTRPANWF